MDVDVLVSLGQWKKDSFQLSTSQKQQEKDQ